MDSNLSNYLWMIAGLAWIGLYSYGLILKPILLNKKAVKEGKEPTKTFFASVLEGETLEDRAPALIALIFIFGIGFFIFWAGGNAFLGNEKVGSFFQKEEYETYYYVNLFPENAKSKNYKVKGLVSRLSDYDSGGYYRLEEVYWDNGGKTVFDDCEIEKKDDKYVGDGCFDTEDGYWKIELAEKYQ